jgi:hypothetical protein
VAALRHRFAKRREYVVSVEHPSRGTGFPHRVKARSADEALRKTRLWMFRTHTGETPWYRWHFEVLDV